MAGVMHNYTTYLTANGQIRLFDADIAGPRIGLCSTNITLIDTKIDVSGRGCEGDQGLGRGHQHGSCAGSGGAHRGRGGYGGMEFNDGNSESG